MGRTSPGTATAISSATISGTVTGNQGTPNTVANGWPVKITDGTDTAQVSAAGALLIDGSATIQPVSGSVTVTQATGTNLHTVVDSGTITTVSTVTNLAQMAGAAISMGNGTAGTGAQRVTIASDSTGQVALAAGSAVIGHVITDATSTTAVTQATASSLNATVVGTGTFVVQATLAAETTKVIGTARIIGNGGATIDSTVGAGTAPTNQVVVGALYNSTEISPTTGQAFALQADSKGRLRNVIMDAAGNTRGANVDANSNLGVVLAAETTKVLGVTRTADGAGNLLTSNSTTYTAKFGLDNNLLGTLGTAFSTAGKVDVKAADGDVFVRQTTGSNLHMVVDSGTITTVSTVTTLTGTTTLTPGTGATNLGKAEDAVHASGDTGVFMLAVANEAQSALAADGDYIAHATDTKGNTLAVGNLASDAVDAGNPVKIGFQARQTLPTAVADADRVNGMADDMGRQVTVLGTPRDLRGSQTTTISASTAETTIITAGAAGVFNDLVMLIISNTSATATRVDIRDATSGTIIFSLMCPAGQPAGFSMPGQSIPQTTAANNWTAQSSASVTDLRVFAVYEKNK